MKDRGFSFLEILLATVLLSIGLVGLVNAFSIGLSESSQAKQYTVAKNLAEEKLEEIRNTSYANVVIESPAVPVSGFLDYRREVLVSEIPQPGSGLKELQINVFWQAKGGEVSISLASYVSNI